MTIAPPPEILDVVDVEENTYVLRSGATEEQRRVFENFFSRLKSEVEDFNDFEYRVES